MFSTLFFSLGTPMLLAGDEFGRTQAGNNNAYCQDNEISWMDWQLADSLEGRRLTAFVARLAELRRRYPILRSPYFLHGQREFAPGILDIDWFDTHGKRVSTEAWINPEKRLLALRRAGKSADGTVLILTLYLNPTNQNRSFRIAEPHLPTFPLIDSAAPEVEGGKIESDTILVGAHSAVLTLASTSSGNG